MEDKVKNWIEGEYNSLVKWGGDIDAATTRAYGVLMFAINTLFDTYNEELGKWWDAEMLPKFRALKP